MLRKFILATTFLVPLSALADDDFGISDEPVKKEAPVLYNYVQMGIGFASQNPMAAYRFGGLAEGGVLPQGSLSYLYRSPWDAKGAPEFLRITGHSSGEDSRRLAVEGGEQGVYKLSFGYESLPFNDFTGLTPFNGEGSANLSLVPGWTRAGSVANLSTATIAKMKSVDVRTERERFGSGLTWHIDQEYSVRMAARQERKEGLKTIGVGSSASLSVVAPEPVNYQDDRVEAELAYAGKRAQWRVGYNLSLFRNEDASLTLQNPFNGVNVPATQRMALAPDNTAHSFFADGGYQFTDTTRLVANLSYSEYLQDETFLPYSTQGFTVNHPMPRQSLNGRIATTTANLELTTKPLSRLDMKTRYRFTDRHNDTPINQYVYVFADGNSQDNLIATPASSRARRNTPYSYQENLASLDFGYALDSRNRLLAGYEYRTFQRDLSERAKNVDNTAHVGLRTKLAEGLTGNAKLSRMFRDGSTYSPTGSIVNTNSDAFRRNTPNDNHVLLRKYFEADLVRDRAQAGLTYAPTEALSLGLSGGVTLDEYTNSELGLTDSRGTHVSLDANYTLSPELALNGFYTYEHRTTDQAGWTGFSRNSWNRWYVNILDDAHTIGMGSKWQVAEGLALLADYAFVWTVSEVDARRDDNSRMTPVGASFPDITSRSHSISLRAEYDLTERVVMGLGYALELYRSKDWALDDLNANSTSALTMGEQSANYDAHLFLVTARYKF